QKNKIKQQQLKKKVQKMAKFVPENVQKKQQRDEKLRKSALEARKTRSALMKQRKAEWTSKAQKYESEYVAQERRVVEEKRKARKSGSFFVPAEPKVAFVIRIRGVNQLHPDVIRILRLFRLRQIHNGTFFKVNKSSLNMLKKVLPFVTLGYPNRQTISKLILKRGFAKVNGQRIPITDNTLIEQNLGKYNINCFEDLVHEITTCGPHFKEANNFLWPFKLDTPRGGFRNKRHAFHQGGDWGNREVFINDLVKAML
ncbi:hypothetical protein IMG5_126280, partial [Ichthyophthirius multifiliis]